MEIASLTLRGINLSSLHKTLMHMMGITEIYESKMRVLLTSFNLFLMSSTNTHKNIHSVNLENRCIFYVQQGWNALAVSLSENICAQINKKHSRNTGKHCITAQGPTESLKWLWQISQNWTFLTFPIQFCKQPALEWPQNRRPMRQMPQHTCGQSALVDAMWHHIHSLEHIFSVVGVNCFIP